MWSAARAHDPPTTDLFLHWVSWDEPLASDMVVHFYVANTALYNELATLVHHLQGQIGMVSHQFPEQIEATHCL